MAGRILRWAPVAAGLAGIVLLVLGGLGFLSASDDRDRADELASRRQESKVAERDATEEKRRLLRLANRLTEDVSDLEQASADLTDAENALSAALDEAVGFANAGNVSEARRRYEAQAGAVADLEAKLAEEHAALERARQRLAELESEAAS